MSLPNTAIAVIGIDIGKCGKSGRVASGSAARQYTALPDRHGSLCRRASPEPQTRSLGRDARLMPAKYVRPYSKGQKNDFNDAEAVQRPTMKFVATKTAEQIGSAGAASGTRPAGCLKMRGSQRALVQHGPLRLAPWRPSLALRLLPRP